MRRKNIYHGSGLWLRRIDIELLLMVRWEMLYIGFRLKVAGT
jgi:hypothetical protein